MVKNVQETRVDNFNIEWKRTKNLIPWDIEEIVCNCVVVALRK
jgi:hypothetical protein